jgi:hypothetical protein
VITQIVHIKSGEITNDKAFDKTLSILSDGAYRFLIDRATKRSVQQNSYYWGVVVPKVRQGLRDAGYNEVKTAADAHDIIKHLFLKKEMRSEKNDDVITIAGSTSELTTVKFMELIEDVVKWAAEYLGVQILFPGEQAQIFE